MSKAVILKTGEMWLNVILHIVTASRNEPIYQARKLCSAFLCLFLRVTGGESTHDFTRNSTITKSTAKTLCRNEVNNKRWENDQQMKVDCHAFRPHRNFSTNESRYKRLVVSSDNIIYNLIQRNTHIQI